ncbi:MAG: hypothetical protein JWN98_1880 [Abditibacteriota bacterium]|nr:hypothetical protein [Abditibacteriota bacterium]
MDSLDSHNSAELMLLIERAQGGDNACVEALLQKFRPLLRSRMHWLWIKLREEMTGVEWADVEAQVQVIFIARLQEFRSEQGVFFPHYIARMLDFDTRHWLRTQRRGSAVPFSQLHNASEDDDDYEWWLRGQSHESATPETDQSVSMQDALKVLSDAQRDVVWRCCVQGHSEVAVATQLGVSRSAVRNRLQSTLSHLREFFGEPGALVGSIPLNDQSVPVTRTGRRVSRAVLAHYAFWIWRMSMSRDEKRPDLVGVGSGQPVLMQGVFDFQATGLKTPQLLSPKLRYIVPAGYVAGIRLLYVKRWSACPQSSMACRIA